MYSYVIFSFVKSLRVDLMALVKKESYLSQRISLPITTSPTPLQARPCGRSFSFRSSDNTSSLNIWQYRIPKQIGSTIRRFHPVCIRVKRRFSWRQLSPIHRKGSPMCRSPLTISTLSFSSDWCFTYEVKYCDRVPNFTREDEKKMIHL